jgi:predicted transcriptional regulator
MNCHKVRGISFQFAMSDGGRELAKTSVITTLNTMFGKKYLKRKKQGDMYLFTPCISEDQVNSRVLGDVVDRVFDGSASAVPVTLFEVLFALVFVVFSAMCASERNFV